jgi:hypothetical protein
MIGYLPIQGTEGWQVDDPDPRHPRNWWRQGSLLVDELASHGLALLCPEDPFVWSTDLDGEQFWERWPWFRSRKDKRDWLAGGKALRWYLLSRFPLASPRPPLVLLTHSHGVQIAHYAAAEGLRIDYLLDIAGPVRADVLQETAAGLKNIGHWMHVTDGDGDLIQTLGRIGDGHVGGAVQLPQSVQIVRHDGIDHSELLSNTKFVPSTWRALGLVDFLLGAEVAHV